MKSKNEKTICCEVKKIHKPKPKKMFKINDCYKGNIKCNPGHRKLPNYNYDIHKKKKNEYNNKNKYNKFDFDSISLEEIEKDFIAFKSKNEVLKVENELLQILLEPSNKEKCNNIKNNRIKKQLTPEEIKCTISKNIHNKK